MNHFAKIAAQLESRDLDGMLLTHDCLLYTSDAADE